jgi:hypothetical protein
VAYYAAISCGWSLAAVVALLLIPATRRIIFHYLDQLAEWHDRHLNEEGQPRYQPSRVKD